MTKRKEDKNTKASQMWSRGTPERAVADLLESLGLDTSDPNLVDTPERVAKMLRSEVQTPRPKLPVFPAEYDQMVILKDHEVWSRCPHHLERVHYIVHVGYIPRTMVVGLSKLARIVDYIASGWKLQEDITKEIADFIDEELDPLGCGCIVTGTHFCMRARGVESNATVKMQEFRGYFLSIPHVKQEFMEGTK